MLAGAPLFAIQIRELEFRQKMIHGNTEALKTIRMGTQLTAAEFLKMLGALPPLALLRLCNQEVGDYVRAHLLRQADDMDYVQNVISAAGRNAELNPTLNAVLAGFSRRKRVGKFKDGQHNLDFDRLRFAHTATPRDNDLLAKKVEKKPQKQSTTRHPCWYFQKARGCLNSAQDCRFTHTCMLCYGMDHGAANCPQRNRSPGQSTRTPVAITTEEKSDSGTRRERPPNPRYRRARAAD